MIRAPRLGGTWTSCSTLLIGMRGCRAAKVGAEGAAQWAGSLTCADRKLTPDLLEGVNALLQAAKARARG